MVKRKYIPTAPMVVRLITPWLELCPLALSWLPLPGWLPHHLKGAIGETAACRFLKNKKVVIWYRNWRGKSGEIDVVAIHQGTLVFAEIKTRSAGGNPEFSAFDSITLHKKEQIKALAREFIREFEPQIRIRRLQKIRFDTIGVYYPSKIGGRIRIEHKEASFNYDSESGANRERYRP